MKVQIALVAALVICYGSLVEGDTANLISTLRITTRLCLCPTKRTSPAVAEAFYACYDNAPGKAQFTDCQIKTFGGPINTVANVANTCNHPWKLPSYVSCMKEEFAAAGLDLDDAVTKVNACQSQVVGIN